jgi:hypothetical protein
MTSIHKILLAASALLLFAATPVVHAADPLSDDPAAYIAGTKAMNDRRWQDAVRSFDQVINAKQAKTDAALYWKAYSLNKLGNQSLALATCTQLHSQYASSTWNKDCEALGIDAGAFAGPVPPVPPVAPLPPLSKVMIYRTDAYSKADRDYARADRDMARGESHDPDADIKMLALNSLLNQDPARAIPLLRGILSGNQPANIKRHAIFVLAQSKSPEAQAILNDAVLGKLDPTLQREAIQSMGIYKGKAGNETLVEVYNKTSDPKIKQAVISAFFISQDAPRMVELAKNEKNLELKRNIVSQLAVMHDKAATDYMIELLK